LDTGKIRWFVPLEQVNGDQSPIVDEQGILLRVAAHRKSGLVYQSLRFQADSGQPETPPQQDGDSPGISPVFIWRGLRCRGTAGPNPGSGDGATLLCDGEGRTLKVAADTYEPASGEYETAFSVANLLFVGSTVIEEK
jgi:hypothetical protein